MNALAQDNADVNLDGKEELVPKATAPDLTVVPCAHLKRDVGGVILSKNVCQAMGMLQISKVVQIGFTISVQLLDPTQAVQTIYSQSSVTCATATKVFQKRT